MGRRARVAAALVVSASLLVCLAFACTPPRAAAPWLYGDDPRITFVLPSSRGVALTIDDGPDPIGTPAILAALDEHDAIATFFLIGSHAASHPALVRDIVDRGHAIANHDWTDRQSAFADPEGLERALRRTHDTLARFASVTHFRPGGGLADDALLDRADALGYEVVLGDVYPQDALLPWSGFHAWYIRRHVRPGSIVILHDGPARGPRTANTLRAILPTLRDRGLGPVRLGVGRGEG